MHIVLTDILTCPRCGPEYGLILVADRTVDRRVQAGALGCANCREKYVVRDGIVYFGGDPGGAADAGVDGADRDVALRLGALLGVTHGPGFLVLVGPGAVHARELAALIEDIEVVAVETGTAAARAGGAGAVGAPAAGAQPGVNRLVAGAAATRLPLATGKVPGVALTGAAADALLEEGVRLLSPVGRLVLDPAPADAVERLAALKLRPLAEDGTTLVAARY